MLAASWMEREAQFFSDLDREPVAVGIVELHVERFQPAQHGQTDAARGDGADGHAFDVVGPLDAVGDVPAALNDPLVGRDVVADQAQDHHHHVLGDADAVAERDLGHGDPMFHGGLQVDVI